MSLLNSPKIITDGLVFAYDMNNGSKSWKGKPTINHAYGQNARSDSSYNPYVWTTSGTWQQKHPNALRVYNFQGNEITGYVNSGVTDSTNTYHAIWTLDPILKKPVVTMRDFDGQWKAKSFGLTSGTTPNSMGVGYGDLYTISWLQWTDNISKSVNAGLYGQNTSGSNGFHDGLSQYANYDASHAFNTKPYTWQRVWATFQVSTARNLGASWSCYMYGHYNTRATVKIADVQIETGYVSGFLENGASSRSNTQALLDLTGNNTITANNLAYTSDGSFIFSGTNSSYVDSGQNIPNVNSFSLECWVNPANSQVQYSGIMGNHGSGGTTGVYCQQQSTSLNNYTWGYGNGTSWGTGCTFSLASNQWHHLVLTKDSTYNKVYVNGSLTNTVATNGAAVNGGFNFCFGRDYASSRYFNGKISSGKLYNRALSADEVKQNFNALRGRYGI